MKRVLCLVLVCCIMCSACIMQGVTVFADDEITYYLGTEIPALEDDENSWAHTVFNNHIIYWYNNKTEQNFHNYRYLLESNGFNLYEVKDNSEYLADYNSEYEGTTVKYSKQMILDVAFAYVTYYKKQGSISVQVCDSNGYYDAVTASDDNSYHAGCQGALLCYRRGRYQKAMELLNNYIDKDEQLGHPFGELSADEGEFFNQLYANVEYAIKYSDAISNWMSKLNRLINDGLYYETLAEAGWLRQTYKLSPYDLAWVQCAERLAQKSLNEYQFLTGLNKAINYYNNGMYDEARDELIWIKDIPIEIQSYIDKYNEIAHALNDIY